MSNKISNGCSKIFELTGTIQCHWITHTSLLVVGFVFFFFDFSDRDVRFVAEWAGLVYEIAWDAYKYAVFITISSYVSWADEKLRERWSTKQEEYIE
jgi:hypothetical protein